MEGKFNPHILHKVAVFLNPLQKSMRFLSEDDRDQVIDYVNDRVDGFPLRVLQQHEEVAAPEPPTKRRRCNINAYDDIPEEGQALTEVDEYQQLSIRGRERDLSLLQWWKQHANQFPALSTVAASVHCVMATSAPSERNFSVAGFVVSERRSSLKPSSVNDILFVNSAKRAARV